MTSHERLAAALRHQAKGVYCLEAAAELLIANRSWLNRTDFTDQFIHVLDGQTMAVINWEEAVTALQTGHLRCSRAEHQILRIAASLAEGINLSLQDALTGLDDTNLDLVAATILHAGGRRSQRHH